MEIQHLPINKLKLNPANPRFIRDDKFEKLVKSLADCPDLFDTRPCICSDRTGDPIILGGNMRWRAAKDLKWEKVPAIILSGLTENQEKEIAIKDNGDFGQWDWEALVNEWNDLPLEDWGINLPSEWLKEDDPNEEYAGMPEFGEEGKAFRTIHVHFKNENDVISFAQQIGQEISEKSKTLWYPPIKKESYNNMRFEDGD